MKLNKLGRNDECHCGSGNKYKRCCLSSDATRPQNAHQLNKIAQIKSASRLRNRVKNNIGDNFTVVQGEIEGVKMSEVILDLADFLLKIATNKKQREAAITITCTAWNIAVEGSDKGQELLDAYFKKIDDPIHQKDTLDIISAIIKRKQACYPDINRVVLDYELVDSMNNIHLNVVSTVPQEFVAKLKQEQATQLVVNHHDHNLSELIG